MAGTRPIKAPQERTNKRSGTSKSAKDPSLHKSSRRQAKIEIRKDIEQRQKALEEAKTRGLAEEEIREKQEKIDSLRLTYDAMDVVPTDETPLSDPPAAQPETKPITSTEVDQAASQSSFKNEETPPGFFSSGSLQPSSSADSASTSRSTLSPDSVGDCDSEDGRIAAEEFGMVEALPSYSEGDVLEGRIKGPGNSAYRIYRKGSDKDPFYYMLKTKSSAIEGEVDLDAESYGTKNIGVTKKGQIKSFAGVVCKTGTLGLAPIEWKTNKNGNYIRPCHRIKVNWRAGDQVIPSWEKRGTIKRYWLDAGYMDPSNNPTMEVTNDVKIHDSVVLKEGQTIEKLSFAILKAAIRCDKNYALAQANDRSRRSVTPNFPQDSDHEM